MSDISFKINRLYPEVNLIKNYKIEKKLKKVMCLTVQFGIDVSRFSGED
jgi:hypothetical protein